MKPKHSKSQWKDPASWSYGGKSNSTPKVTGAPVKKPSKKQEKFFQSDIIDDPTFGESGFWGDISVNIGADNTTIGGGPVQPVMLFAHSLKKEPIQKFWIAKGYPPIGFRCMRRDRRRWGVSLVVTVKKRKVVVQKDSGKLQRFTLKAFWVNWAPWVPMPIPGGDELEFLDMLGLEARGAYFGMAGSLAAQESDA